MFDFLKSIFSEIVEPPQKRITRDMILRANARMIAGAPIEKRHHFSAEAINYAGRKALHDMNTKYRDKTHTPS